MASEHRDSPIRMLPAALLVLGLATLPPARAHAQAPDSLTTWLDWGSLAFLIKADTSHGVQLWANALVARKNGAEPRTFVARYDPAAVAMWAMDAELLLLPDRAGPSDPPRLLGVSPLVDLYGGKFVVARRREGARWSKRVVFSFAREREEPLTFSVERKLAAELFSALARAGRSSRLRDEKVTSRLDDGGNDVPSSHLPERIAIPVLRYPPVLAHRGIPGLTVVSFVVDTAGRAVMDEGFRVVFSTDPAFTQSARDAVEAARFRPASAGGQPQRVPVCQSIYFSITMNPRDRDR